MGKALVVLIAAVISMTAAPAHADHDGYANGCAGTPAGPAEVSQPVMENGYYGTCSSRGTTLVYADPAGGSVVLIADGNDTTGATPGYAVVGISGGEATVRACDQPSTWQHDAGVDPQC